MGDPSNVDFGPRRLSKPRTIKSSSNLLSEQPTTPSSPHNSSDQDYFGRDAVVVHSRGERRSRSKSRSRIRAYLYGSSHDAIQTSSDDEEVQTGIASAARDVRKRLSRTGSSITPFQSAKVSVTRLSASSSSRLLSTRSTDSQKTDLEESAMVADQIKQRAHHDSLVAQNHVSTPVDEGRHVDSVLAPLRRKSLYTPGIATRNASDILRKPPKPSIDHDYYYDPSQDETSPLPHLAGLGKDGRSTPSDLHYSHLGGIQLGTLRITNGTNSPVPGDHHIQDLANRSPTPESKTNDEYYTASEGSVTGERDHATTLPTRGGSPLKFESEIETSVRTDDQVPGSPDTSLPFERESSNESFPFERETASQTARSDRGKTDQLIRFRKETPSEIPRLQEETSNESVPCQRESSKPCSVEAKNVNSLLPLERETLNESISFENQSCEEFECSRGETSTESSPPMMGSSKTFCVDGRAPNESFPSKSGTPDELVRFEGFTLSESLSFKRRTSRACTVDGKTPDERFRFLENSPNGAPFIADEYIAELDGSLFSDPSFDDKRDIIPHSHHPAEERWRSFINDAEAQHACNATDSREDALRKLTVNSNTQSTWRPDRLSVPSSKPSRYSASSEMPQIDSGYCSYTSLTGAPAHEVGFQTRGKPIPSNKVSASLPPQAAETVRSSARSSFPIPIRKLQKQRPKSQPPLVNLITAQRLHELNDTHIPRIPSIIASRHANRLSQFPLLEHTFPSSQHTTADKSLSPTQVNQTEMRFPSPSNAFEAASAKHRAVLNLGDNDEWGASDLVRSPSWSEFGGGKRRKEQKKLAKEEKHLGKRIQREKKEDDKQMSNRSSSTSRTRARSSEGQSRCDTLATIADFGTVTESLGNSPYDIATAMAKPASTSRSTSNWHPHQISTAMPRPKSLVGARIRPQSMFTDVSSVPALAAVDIKAHDLKWARDRQRSQSFSSAGAHGPESFNDRGILRKSLRPHSDKMDDTPPVPALPSIQQVRQREAAIIRSRPHSMIVEAPVPTPTSDSPKTNQQKAAPYPPEPGTSAIRRKMKGSKPFPDIWSNGSLERKSPKTVDRSRQASNNFTSESDEGLAAKDNLWESQSHAWSQGRRSAGEALLRSQVRDVFDSHEAANLVPLDEHSNKPPSLARAFTSGAYQNFTPSPSHLGPFPNPLASHPQMTTQQPTSTSNTPCRLHQSATQQTQRPGFSPFASSPRPSVSTPTSALRRALTQSFQIPRKRVGSGSSIAPTETAIGSSHHKVVLI